MKAGPPRRASSAARHTNGLKAEPGCRRASTVRLNWLARTRGRRRAHGSMRPPASTNSRGPETVGSRVLSTTSTICLQCSLSVRSTMRPPTCVAQTIGPTRTNCRNRLELDRRGTSGLGSGRPSGGPPPDDRRCTGSSSPSRKSGVGLFRCSGCPSCTPVFRVADRRPRDVSSGSAMKQVTTRGASAPSLRRRATVIRGDLEGLREVARVECRR